MVYRNSEGPDFYGGAPGWVYDGPPGDDGTFRIGYVDAGGWVYDGLPGDDCTFTIGYVDAGGRVYNGPPGDDRTSSVGYVDAGGRVYDGFPGDDRTSQVGYVESGGSAQELAYFGGACLLLWLREREKRAIIAARSRCPNCGSNSTEQIDHLYRLCRNCGLVFRW